MIRTIKTLTWSNDNYTHIDGVSVESLPADVEFAYQKEAHAFWIRFLKNAPHKTVIEATIFFAQASYGGYRSDPDIYQDDNYTYIVGGID